MAKKTETKEEILKAAAAIINADGVLSLTLEAVARQAAISKGGLLYHFPSKDALLRGMIDYLTESFTQEINAAVEQDACEQGKWARAYTLQTFTQFNVALNTAFLAAVATNPDLIKPMAEKLEALQKCMENDNIDPIMATIIRLAADGIYFNQLYGMELQEELRENVLKRLISLTKEG